MTAIVTSGIKILQKSLKFRSFLPRFLVLVLFFIKNCYLSKNLIKSMWKYGLTTCFSWLIEARNQWFRLVKTSNQKQVVWKWRKWGCFEYDKVGRNDTNEKITQWDVVSISQYYSACYNITQHATILLSMLTVKWHMTWVHTLYLLMLDVSLLTFDVINWAMNLTVARKLKIIKLLELKWLINTRN